MATNPNNQSSAPPIPPIEPESWACCGNECGDSCVFEIYRREKAEYEAALNALKAEENTHFELFRQPEKA